MGPEDRVDKSMFFRSSDKKIRKIVGVPKNNQHYSEIITALYCHATCTILSMPYAQHMMKVLFNGLFLLPQKLVPHVTSVTSCWQNPTRI